MTVRAGPRSYNANDAHRNVYAKPVGNEYETVAASQTAQVLGAAGAVGDYLSHVNVQPTSTTVGVVKVLDNAVEVHAYPGGTVGADLKPFIIPIGAHSVSGAWKITTGAGITATAFGDFT